MDKSLITSLAITNPIALLMFKKEEEVNYINSLLPYSIGFEIECNSLENFDPNIFKVIPDIMHVDCDNGEKRFRIPNGIRGLICLHNICIMLPKQCSLNTGSGIHYHIDCTDVYTVTHTSAFILANNDWIINELLNWGTVSDVANYVARCSTSRGWVRYSSLNTIEFRVGEMTFDYSLIVTRMFSCTSIVSKLKLLSGIGAVVKYEKINTFLLFTYLKTAVVEMPLILKSLYTKEDLLKQELEKLSKEHPVNALNIAVVTKVTKSRVQTMT